MREDYTAYRAGPVSYYRIMAFVHEIYGMPGNYHTPAEELHLANETGFEVQTIHQIPLAHYHKTLDRWLAKLYQHRVELTI